MKADLTKAHPFWVLARDGAVLLDDDWDVPMLFRNIIEAKEHCHFMWISENQEWKPMRSYVMVEE